MDKHFLDASHGAIGGAPGFHDSVQGDGSGYNYPTDRQNSIHADRLIREAIILVGVPIRIIPDEEYGMPVNDPVAR